MCMKNVGICLRPQGYQRPRVPSDRGPTIRPATTGRTNGDGKARSRGTADDRRGGRLVRVSRGDPGAVGDAIPRAGAVGLGAPDAADARNQDPPGEAPPRGGRIVTLAAMPSRL